MGGKLRGGELSIGKCKKEKIGFMISLLDVDGRILCEVSSLYPRCFVIYSSFSDCSIEFASCISFYKEIFFLCEKF